VYSRPASSPSDDVFRSSASCRAAFCAAAQLSVVARDAHVSPQMAPSSLSHRTLMMVSGKPVSSQTACIVAV
jgi:hypothetical protein